MPSDIPFPRLNGIGNPSDLRKLPESELKPLAGELREFLIETLSKTGGHFAANLGTVELAIALHYVFDTPNDRLVWDVGHQAYPHKILTGRREQLHTIRQTGGLAPFPKRAESPYDTFGVGHSSTSIGAALGMAIAAAQNADDKKTPTHKSVAVIGDGAMTAGMAFEALNHAGSLDADLLVVLNDNDMSISENVGGMSNYLTKLLSGRIYYHLREGSKKVLSKMPTMWELARRSEEHMKGMVLPGTLFEELGFNYFGPVDGHDLNALVPTLRNLSKTRGPRFLHVVTRKGKGYAPAEADPIKWHGPGAFDPKAGTIHKKPASSPSYSQVFSDWLCDMAATDERLMGITPAMREGSGLVEFSKQFPDRYFDVGIAEQHSVTLAAGMACDGLKPVVAIYSTFLQRAYDQLIHDVAIQKLPVLFALDRAGLVGADGPTHAGSFDHAFLRCIPNMVVMAPADENECRQMLTTGFKLNQPAAVRYPRGTGPGTAIDESLDKTIEIGKAELRRSAGNKADGKKVALLGFGAMVPILEPLAEELDATLYNMRFVKPLDEAAILDAARTHELLVTVEDASAAGGAGSGVNECLAAHNVAAHILNLGLPDQFIEHGSREDCLAMAGLDKETLCKRIKDRLQTLEQSE